MVPVTNVPGCGPDNELGQLLAVCPKVARSPHSRRQCLDGKQTSFGQAPHMPLLTTNDSASRCRRQPIDKAFRIAPPMRKASWTKRFAAGWGERRRAQGDRGSSEGGWWGWAGDVSEKSLPMRAAFEKPRSLWLENAAQECRNRRFRLPAGQGHGTPKRGYSPRNRVRQLPQWGHRGRAAS